MFKNNNSRRTDSSKRFGRANRNTNTGNRDTSWNKVGGWYNKIVGDEGHFYHQSIVIPNSLKLLGLTKTDTLIDIACGQGIFSRSIPDEIKYLGVDLAESLIKEANKKAVNKNHNFLVSDVTKNLPTNEKFTKAVMILALQNVKFPEKTIKLVSEKLEKNGEFLIVLNHPCFRIPRQSSWEIDEKNKLQYRRINKYLSKMEIPITAHPSQKNSSITWSFHRPIKDYSQYLFDNGFVIKKIEEWSSTKSSEGKKAKMENRSREEFPMFMAILAKKVD